MKQVRLKTNMGDITLELDEAKTPVTTQNFINYVNDHYYDGTVFHRVIKGFMIQGGGFESGMAQKKSKAPIQNEAKNGLKNEIGSIAMARTDDPHSASSQFFINVANNDFLNFKSESREGYGYCAFGKVTDGLDIVKKISETSTTRKNGHADVPVEDIIILSAEVI